MKCCACGLSCECCGHYSVECGGCKAARGAVYWTAYCGMECCPIYACAREKGLDHCGQCRDLPCAIWDSLRDPDETPEQTEKSIAERLRRLQDEGAK